MTPLRPAHPPQRAAYKAAQQEAEANAQAEYAAKVAKAEEQQQRAEAQQAAKAAKAAEKAEQVLNCPPPPGSHVFYILIR